ncbi:MAG: aldolase [Verrucomicrobia bacterium]|nr:aldolase [Verrucomicrobiota bacterium]
MNLGKQVRLNRLFSHPSGRLCSVAMDHFIGYNLKELPAGLRQVAHSLDQIVAGRPDSVTLHKGLAAACWPKHAGRVPLILQSTLMRPDDSVMEQIADPEDAVRFGADAFAVCAFVRGATEGRHLKTMANTVKQAARFEMPVIAHAYPRKFDNNGPRISNDAEDVAWAVRCALECGVDVIKTPYCGEVSAFAQIVAECPLPIVAAGGPQSNSLLEALQLLADVARAGGRGAVVGRNVWGVQQVTEMVRTMRLVIHDGKTPEQAMRETGLRN